MCVWDYIFTSMYGRNRGIFPRFGSIIHPRPDCRGSLLVPYIVPYMGTLRAGLRVREGG